MTNILFETAYIKSIFENNSEIELIEVWDRVLYARMKEGCGLKNIFISKKGLNFNLPVYYLDDFKKISKRYHPDRVEQSSSKQKIATKLFQHINISKQALRFLFTGRRLSGITFITTNELFGQFRTSKFSPRSTIFREQIQREASKAGYSDEELFGEYISHPLSDQAWRSLQYIDSCKEIIEQVKEALINRVNEIKEAKPWLNKYATKDRLRHCGI